MGVLSLIGLAELSIQRYFRACHLAPLEKLPTDILLHGIISCLEVTDIFRLRRVSGQPHIELHIYQNSGKDF